MEEKKKTQQRHKQRHIYKGRIQRACKRRNTNNNNNNTLKFETWTNKNAEEKLLHSPNAFLVQERMREATSKQFSRHCAILNHLDFLKLLHCTSPSLLLLSSSFSSSSSSASASSAYLLSLASSLSPVRRIAKFRSTSNNTTQHRRRTQAPLSVLPLNVWASSKYKGGGGDTN